MSRAPSTNGHPAESVRHKGGYDAFFMQAEQEPGSGPVAGNVPARPNPGFNEPVIGAPGQSTPQAAPAGPAAPQSATAPQAGVAHTAGPHAAAPNVAGPTADSARETYGTATSSSPETWTAHAGAEPATARITQTASNSANTSSGDTGPSVERPGAESADTPWQPAQSTSWVPDRIDRTTAAPVEVLPAALTSMDLLADISAANRARLQSSTGVRGALNKVGFRLGLSPAEQRAEDRRARIRTQLNTPYQIAVISVKGGVGRTTTAATLGSTFAALRPDRVVAVDGNPDFGDLPTRTAPHPYGLTLRDLAQASNLEAFSTVQSFMSINSADLAVIASPWTIEANEALSGREYATAVEVLRRHFNLLLVDCGTGVLDSVTMSVLQTSDAVVVVTPPTVGGVKGAVATLNWLSSHGMQHLIAKSVVTIVHQQPTKPVVDVAAIEKLFATGQRPTCILPYDDHLAEGGEIDLRLVEKETLLAFEELAAGLSDGFPNYLGGTSGGRTAGGWR
ncbi:AAA family ATPase [Nocardia vinacea]|uniref:AAA family ATPase n=1 Tax=Nocardia vinacea TaxID=96468 RepID=UPI002E1246A9|nr:AAA family ATPase [Nocardia vinacea]